MYKDSTIIIEAPFSGRNPCSAHTEALTVYARKLNKDGLRTISAGVSHMLLRGSQDNDLPTFWLPLYST